MAEEQEAEAVKQPQETTTTTMTVRIQTQLLRQTGKLGGTVETQKSGYRVDKVYKDSHGNPHIDMTYMGNTHAKTGAKKTKK